MAYMGNLLATKNRPPRIGVETIWRNRLLEGLEGYEKRKLTVVAAPSGYGKTVLVSQFAAGAKRPVVWYQLDGFDNDLTMFIRHFIAGVSGFVPHFGLQVLALIDGSEDVLKKIHHIVVLLANELEARAEEGLVFIFDDFHLIDEPAIHEFTNRLIECIPENVHLVISSRQRLPFNLGRLKAHGLVNELNREQLEFSREEIEAFFRLSKDESPSAAAVERAAAETGGWAVALSLMKTSLAGGRGGECSPEPYNPDNREEVYVYLAQEVFGKLPQTLRNFLADTSVLEAMTPEMCDELVGREDSGEIFKDLMDRNIFLMKLEGESEAYRYHHLFRDFLRGRLGQRKAALMERAGDCHLRRGSLEQAAEYYLEAEAFDKVVAAVEEAGGELLKRGEWQTVDRWIGRIPRTFAERSPWLLLHKGVIYSYRGMWKEGLAQIDKALGLFRSAGDKEGILSGSLQKSNVLRRAGLLDESLEMLDEIQPLVEGYPIAEWYDVLLEKVNILLWKGRLKEAVDDLETGIEFARKDDEQGIVAYFLEHLGATYYATGDYRKAVECYDASRERCALGREDLSEIERERYSQRTTLARIYRDWGELDRALVLIREEIGTKERLGLIDDLPRAYHQLALMHNDLGDKAKSEEYFRRADEMYRRLDKKDFQWTWHLALYGKILADNGKVAEGKARIERAMEEAKSNSEFNLAVCEFVGVSAYLQEGEVGRAMELLAHALEVGRRVGAKVLICQCCWVLANVHSRLGSVETARSFASECLSLAAEGNYMQVFLSYEASSFPVVKLGIEMGAEMDFIGKVVRKLGPRAGGMLKDLCSGGSAETRERAEALQRMLGEKPKEDGAIEVRCFGTFEVLSKNKSGQAKWKTTKAKEIFVYLLRFGKEPIGRDRLLETMWPGMGPGQTASWLHTYIYQIRRLLKDLGLDKGVLFKGGGYSLDCGRIACDVERFESGVEEAAGMDARERVDRLEKALSLYRGDYMEGFYNQWIIEERRRIEKTYLTAMENIASGYMELGDHDSAARSLRKVLEMEPLSEKANEMLCRAYVEAGDRISAIRQYEEFRLMLERELGIKPGMRMKRLGEEMLFAE